MIIAKLRFLGLMDPLQHASLMVEVKVARMRAAYVKLSWNFIYHWLHTELDLGSLNNLIDHTIQSDIIHRVIR